MSRDSHPRGPSSLPPGGQADVLAAHSLFQDRGESSRSSPGLLPIPSWTRSSLPEAQKLETLLRLPSQPQRLSCNQNTLVASGLRLWTSSPSLPAVMAGHTACSSTRSPAVPSRAWPSSWARAGQEEVPPRAQFHGRTTGCPKGHTLSVMPRLLPVATGLCCSLYYFEKCLENEKVQRMMKK